MTTTPNSDLTALPVGAEADIADNGRAVTVRHEKQGVWLIKREHDGALQTTVWVRQLGSEWGVSRNLTDMGTPAESLFDALLEGVVRSRQALK
jgi:hypothetical protein